MDPEPDPSAFATPTSPTAWRKTFSYVSPHVNYSQLGGGGALSSSVAGTPSSGALSTQPLADVHTLRLLEESRVAAVEHWSRRTVVACCLQIVTAVCEFFSKCVRQTRECVCRPLWIPHMVSGLISINFPNYLFFNDSPPMGSPPRVFIFQFLGTGTRTLHHYWLALWARGAHCASRTNSCL